MKNLLALTKDIWRGYSRWILLAVLIRLLLMPFFTHSDLLSVYQRAHIMLDSGKLFSIFSMNGLHAVFLYLLNPFLPNISWQSNEVITFAFRNWYNFISNPNIFRTLFLFKLPYLIFEILSFITLVKLTQKKAYQKKTILFWLFNPILIFSTYIFGRFDIIVIFFVLIAIYLFSQSKHVFSIMVLSLAAILRFYPLFIVPIFLLMIKPSKRIKLSGAFCLSSLFLFLTNKMLKEPLGPAKKIIGMLSPSHFPFTLKLPVLGKDTIFLFIVAAVLVLIYVYLNIKPSFDNLLKGSLALLLAFFALSYFNPHYFIWVVPFFALLVDKKQVITLYWWQVIFWSIFILKWGNALTTNLLMPASPAFFKQISLFSPENLELVFGTSRSAFTAVAIALIFLLLKSSSKESEVATG